MNFIFLLEIALYFVSFYVKWGYRLSYYAYVSEIILIPAIIRLEKSK